MGTDITKYDPTILRINQVNCSMNQSSTSLMIYNSLHCGCTKVQFKNLYSIEMIMKNIDINVAKDVMRILKRRFI